MSKETRSLVFQVFRGADLISTAELTEESVTIGSGGDALLKIEDAAMAHLHAVINVADDGSVSLFDLGTAMGTRVNGQPITNGPVKHGDVIDIGGIRIILGVKAGEAAAAEDEDFEEEATKVTVAPPAAVATLGGSAPAPEVASHTAQTSDNAPAHDESAEADEHDDHGHDDDVEDVIAVLMRSAANDPQAKGRAKELEVSQIWGEALLTTKRFANGGSVSIGGAGSTFFAPGLSLPNGAPSFTLVRNNAVVVPKGWDGFADVGETRFTFDELVAQGKARVEGSDIVVAMTDDTRVAVDADGMVFFVQMVHPGRSAPFSVMGLLLALDFLFTSIAAFVFFIGFVFLFLMYWMGPPPQNDSFEIPDRLVELMMQKPEPEKKKGANPDAGEGAKAKKEEGKVGKKEAKMDKAKGNKVAMEKQALDKKIVENAGIMGAMNDDALSQTLGQSGLSSDIQGGIGGLIGAKGTQIGSGGLGGRGGGLGGGGTAEGLGGLGTKGIGGGRSGFGSGGGDFGKKGEGGIGTVGGDPIILGALDRSLIDEVIKRHMNQIRYCYQRELTKNNSLAGKIVIKFSIAKDGTVSSAQTKSTSMNNGAVEGCIEKRFLTMQFPQPKGGGIVIVSYPFLFSPG
jgi:hypothetical protein